MLSIILLVLLLLCIITGVALVVKKYFSTKIDTIEIVDEIPVNNNQVTEEELFENNSEENKHIELTDTKTESQKPYSTTGESQIYKEKLKDQRWLNIKDEVLRRDKYVCQQCKNCIDDITQLTNLSELLPYTEFSTELYTYLCDIFAQRDKLIESYTINNSVSIINKESVLKTYNDHLHVVIYSRIEEIDIWGMNRNKRAYTQIISSNNSNCDDLKWLYSDWLGNQTFYKNNSIKYQSVFINYYPDISTDNKYYLKFNYGRAYAPFNGQWSLHKDGFVISFDGYNKFTHNNLRLNVHHRAYSNTGNPWDCNLSDLITLCYKCHIAEHERLENLPPDNL